MILQINKSTLTDATGSEEVVRYSWNCPLHKFTPGVIQQDGREESEDLGWVKRGAVEHMRSYHYMERNPEFYIFDKDAPAEPTANEIKRDFVQAMVHTVEFVGNQTLIPDRGYSWFSVLMKYAPDVAQHFVDHPVILQKDLQQARDVKNMAERAYRAGSKDRGVVDFQTWWARVVIGGEED